MIAPIHTTACDTDHRPFWDSLRSPVAELGTPFYVYFPEQARRAFERFRQGVSAWGNYQIAYSLKTNPFFGLLNDMRSLGAWIEVVSDWEYDLAVRAGFSADKMVFNGPLKPYDSLLRAAQSGVRSINVDSPDEIEHLLDIATHTSKPINVGVRICPADDGGMSRFGLEAATGEVHAAVHSIRQHARLRLTTLHIHLGTQVTSHRKYEEAIRLAQAMWQDLSLGPDVWLDLGGGYPYQHDRSLDDQAFDPVRFFAEIREQWCIEPCPPLLVELGRWIAAPAFAVIARVIACKARSGEPSIIVLDSGTNHNVMGAFYDHMWRFERTREDIKEYRFCGPLCMEDDILSGPFHGRAPAEGSLVATLNAGAYSLSLARTFIQPRPPIISLGKQNTYTTLVPRETLDSPYEAFNSPSHARRDVDHGQPYLRDANHE